jgi:hypothetical protein
MPPVNQVTNVQRDSLTVNGAKFWLQDVRDFQGKLEYGVFLVDETGKQIYLAAPSRSRLVEKILAHPRRLYSPLDAWLLREKEQENALVWHK